MIWWSFGGQIREFKISSFKSYFSQLNPKVFTSFLIFHHLGTNTLIIFDIIIIQFTINCGVKHQITDQICVIRSNGILQLFHNSLSLRSQVWLVFGTWECENVRGWGGWWLGSLSGFLRDGRLVILGWRFRRDIDIIVVFFELCTGSCLLGWWG